VSILANTGSAALRWLFVAVATILVPAAEELLFRAGLFRYLRTRVPRWAAIGFTSVLFGALHVAWGDHMAGLPSLLPLIVLAVVFCLAYERTGTIGTTIVAHACFNLNTMLLVVTGMGS
jgi:membrane protease YdiL (CAAX protease family)